MANSQQNIVILEVAAKMTLKKLATKIAKLFSAKCNKADWHFNGKNLDNAISHTIESIKINPMDKLTCIMLGYEMRIYKRFPRLDNRGWYMSNSSKDSIVFIPTMDILLFGFGMYYTREGPTTYILGYEIFLADDSIKKESVTITKPNEDDEVFQIYFDSSQAPVEVKSGTKISICCNYEHFEESSRLRVGTDGRSYETIEGNEPGLFTIESHSDSGNGTDIGTGQIPEIYYAIKH